MNEEEKKAIEDMNRFANGIDMSCVTARQMQIILNLIEKKKNCINILDDELKERNKTINEKEIIIEKLQKENELAKKQVEYDKTHICTPQIIKLNYIPVQKVKDKIEYLDKQQKQWLEDRELKASDSEIIFARDFLQELLERRK